MGFSGGVGGRGEGGDVGGAAGRQVPHANRSVGAPGAEQTAVCERRADDDILVAVQLTKLLARRNVPERELCAIFAASRHKQRAARG